jgi:hypothetical protein
MRRNANKMTRYKKALDQAEQMFARLQQTARPGLPCRTKPIPDGQESG